MKLIWRIAKTELQLLFLSPIAWILLIIFAIQAGAAFLNNYEESVRTIVLYDELWNVTGLLFGQGGVFNAVQSKLYLYIPLLTMGLMSKELSSGTVKLLYSSPITSGQIILGKFLSMIIYGFALLAILGVFVIFSAFTVPHFDWPVVLTGLLGIFLLFCAYSAIGLFVSCLIQYQVAVAVCTMAVFASLQYIAFAGQDIPLFRDITYWLSISGRADEFISGLIASEDLLYFIIVIALFLLFAVIKLKSDKLSKAVILTTARYSTVLFAAIGLGCLSSRPSLKLFIDTTATKTLTLTPESQDIVKKLKGGLKVTTYVNLMDPRYSMRYAQPKDVLRDMERLKQYVRFKPEMNQDYEFYYDEDSSMVHDPIPLKKRAQTAAEAYQVNFDLFQSPLQMRAKIDLSSVGYKLVRRFERENGEATFLNFYNDMAQTPTERETSAALNILAGAAPVIGFLNGATSRNSKGDLKKDYKYILSRADYRYSLSNQGYRIIDVPSGQNIPANVYILVLADLDKPLPDSTLENIKNYIDTGGNLLIAGDINNQANLNPLLSFLGLQLLPGSLVQQSENQRPNLILAQFAAGSFNIFPKLQDYAGGVVTMPGACALAYDTKHGFAINEVLGSRKFGSWIKAKPLNLLDDKVIFHNEEGDKAGSFPVALALSRKVNGKAQRIFVTGDADFFSNAEVKGSRNGVPAINNYFVPMLFGWLSNDKLPLNITRPIPPDNGINFEYEQLGLLYWMFTGFLPALFAVAGAVIVISRKRA